MERREVHSLCQNLLPRILYQQLTWLIYAHNAYKAMRTAAFFFFETTVRLKARPARSGFMFGAQTSYLRQ